MSKIINYGSGSKYRMRRIRWKRTELITAVLLSVGLAMFILFLAHWLTIHHFD